MIFDWRAILRAATREVWLGVKLVAPLLLWILLWGILCFGLGAVFALGSGR